MISPYMSSGYFPCDAHRSEISNGMKNGFTPKFKNFSLSSGNIKTMRSII